MIRINGVDHEASAEVVELIHSLQARVKEREEQIEAAWAAYPSAGAVRGLVTLDEMVEGLIEQRDELMARVDAQSEVLSKLRQVLNP